MKIQKITPFLWFDHQAQEAAQFYTSVFENSKIINLSPMVSTFELEGQQFMALNGGPHFKFNEAVSFYVNCDNQEEIDFFWDKLISNGGKEGQCGWLKDQFGVSWQIIPTILPELMTNPQKSQKVVAAFMKMKKFDIETLKSV
ncbi:MAG: VOC family protein [Bacteroidetes bacterium]|nr:VOC family protein [Bacteroidota bacterium]MBU1484513.1 VOC family protein [Bacteroidota bacterium]MBU2267808.1 VOC family protein [Bacteroidota bacterium]MBU2375337.1 VOC family protein [Bacteroidota bacterium]